MEDSGETIKMETLAVSLPMDIISNILARLPVKHVTRFKTVRKSWCHLISSPYFSHQHFNSQSSHYEDHIIVFVGIDNCLYYSNLDFSNAFTPTKIDLPGYFFKDIVGSCNGLLLCISLANDVDKSSCLLLVNPSTHKYKVISVIEPKSFSRTYSYGFGYDSKADDYKVVRILRTKIEQGEVINTQVGIYSLKSDSWKIIDPDFSGGDFSYSINGKLSKNNMLHWLFKSCLAIWSFDICNEQWSQMPLPAMKAGFFPLDLTVFDGRLCLLIFGFQSGLYVRDVKNAWVKLLDCNGQPYVGFEYPYPLCYSKSGSEILVAADSSLCWYNAIQKTCRKVKTDKYLPREDKLHMCTRSLVLLPHNG